MSKASFSHRFLTCLVFALAVVLSASSSAQSQRLRLRSQIQPDCPVVAGNANWKFSDIYADGNIAVQGSYNCRGVFIYDLSNPDAPVLASVYNPVPNQAFLEAIVIGNRGYFGSGGTYPAGTPLQGDGVHIVDLTNPYQPVLLGKVNAQNGGGFNGVHEIVVHGNYLIENFNATANKAIKIIDVSDPAAPMLKWEMIPMDAVWVHAVHVRGDRMYTSGWRGMIEIYDISNLAVQPPAFLGAISGDSNNHSSWTSEDGRYLYSCRETLDGDLRVYDVLDPAQPLLVKSVKTSELGLDAISPHNPVVFGDKLYISWYQAGVQVFDISDPVSPRHIAEYDTYDGEYTPQPVNESSLAEADPGDIICGVNIQTGLPADYDGNWAVHPFLGSDKILAGDMSRGLFVIDATGLSSPEITLSGRVLSSSGSGLRDAQVTITRPDGSARRVRTNSMGYYSFDDLGSGSFTVGVTSKRFRFHSRTVELSASLSSFDFVGLE